MLSFATWANYLAWTALIVAFILPVARYVEIQNNYRFQAIIADQSSDFSKELRNNPAFGISVIVDAFDSFLSGFIYFLVLKSISLGLNMIVETDINYRDRKESKKKKKAKPRGDTYEFTELELKIVDDENPPDFYDPFESLGLSKQIEWATKALIAVVIVYNLVRFPMFRDMIAPYFFRDPNSSILNIVDFVFMALNAIVGIAITYYLLKVLADVLKILMEMEFTSRKA